MLAHSKPKVLEFFAGIGLARMGLEQAGFSVTWANDYQADKASLYEGQFRDKATGQDHTLIVGDINLIDAKELPADAALAWGSSPCTDLSLAGSRGGIHAGESNAFWGFIRLLKDLGLENRPPVAVLENVVGLATSHGGDDLAAAIRAFNELGYSVDVVALDARRFVPQSRPRLFLVASMEAPASAVVPNPALRPDYLSWVFSDETLVTHQAQLPVPPDLLSTGLSEYIEDMALSDERWWDEGRTEAFIDSLSSIQADRVTALRKTPGVKYRTAYRRMRKGLPTWEIRADDISGCLRTARGGSSKQAVVRVSSAGVQVRWMTPLEYARLMGAGGYNFSGARTNQALFAFGDAVAVPAVAWLGEHYLMPLIDRSRSETPSLNPTR